MMRTLISCKYHEDSQTVELLYTDGTLIDIDCMAIEDEVARNMYERSELDYLLSHDPVGYADAHKEEGIIWVIESCDLNVFGIRRALWQLREAGWFANVKGFLIGRPLCYGQEIMGLDHYHAVIDVLGEFGVPIVMDLDIGHLPPQMPLLMGSLARVTADGSLTISMKL